MVKWKYQRIKIFTVHVTTIFTMNNGGEKNCGTTFIHIPIFCSLSFFFQSKMFKLQTDTIFLRTFYNLKSVLKFILSHFFHRFFSEMERSFLTGRAPPVFCTRSFFTWLSFYRVHFLRLCLKSNKYKSLHFSIFLK